MKWLFSFGLDSHYWGFPGGSDGKESASDGGDRFDPWVGKIPWRREWLPLQTSVLAWRIPSTEILLSHKHNFLTNGISKENLTIHSLS